MRSTTSALESTPAGHWSCGFRITKPSEMFGGIGSVATSAVPVFENINSTSGNFEMAVSTLRSEEHTSELQSLMRISYAVFCLKKKKKQQPQPTTTQKNKTIRDKNIKRTKHT